MPKANAFFYRLSNAHALPINLQHTLLKKERYQEEDEARLFTINFENKGTKVTEQLVYTIKKAYPKLRVRFFNDFIEL